MKNSKLLGLLASFTKIEWKAFKDFVASPYFNKRPELPLLLAHLQTLAPSFPAEKVQKEVVFQVLYPNKSYADKRMRYEMSYLTKLAEEFLQLERYKLDEFDQKCHFLETMLEKKLDKYYNQEYEKLKKQLDDNLVKSPTTYAQKIRLADIADQYFISKKERRFDENIQISADNLEAYYLSKKLRYWCSMLNREKLFKVKYDFTSQEELFSIITKKEQAVEADIELFYNLYQNMETTDSERYFGMIQEILKQKRNLLPIEDLQAGYGVLINYSARKTREGKEEYLEKALEFYLEGLEVQLFMEDGFLSPWTFKNIVSLGLRLKRYDWAEAFIHERIPVVKPKFRQDALNFNLADLNLHRQDYDKTLEHLHQLNYSDIFFNLDGRSMLLKTYYYLDEVTALESAIASFSIFLRRNKKIPDTTKRRYLNFCDSINKIMKYGNTEKVVDKIQNAKLLANKHWLLEICKE